MAEIHFSDLAESIADGLPPDWESAEISVTGDSDRSVVANLRAVDSIGRFFSTLSSRPAADPETDLLPPGTMWGALRVSEHVGSGRFGNVYRAWDPALEREVALKILRAPSPGEPDVVNEGRLMARLRHPNIVTIHGAQCVDGKTGLWMEFVQGRTLSAELADRGPFSGEELREIGIQLCRALAAMHAAGLVHRDIKAQNVLREDGGRIVLGDFGTGRTLDGTARTSGSLAGTPTHLAPELFAGEAATPRSDLYGLGVLLFHLATLAYPVPGRSLRDLRDAHAGGVRTSLSTLRPDLPSPLTRSIDRALAPDPAARFEDADSMARSLENCGAGTWSKWSGARSFAAAAVVVAAAGVSAFTWQTRQRPAVAIPFAQRDWVLIAEFDNRTGEPTLDGTLEYALERELSNSSFINVVSRPRIEDALELMRKPASTHVDEIVGREVALRDGRIKAIIAGRIEIIGGAYSVSARIVNPADGSTAASVDEASVDAEHLVRAVGRLASNLRNKLGEALPQLTAERGALQKVATPSMRALQLYSQARALTGDVALFGSSETPHAVEQLLRDALLEDPNFVWANILMAHALHAQGRTADVLNHVERAAAAAVPGSVDKYIASGELEAFRGALSSDASRRARHFADALASFAAALQLQPDHAWALACVMNTSEMIGRFPGPEFIERYITARPNNVGVFAKAMDAAIATGDLTLARDYARRGSAVDVSADTANGFLANASANLRMFAVRDALHRRNPQEALAEADRLAQDSRSRTRPLTNSIGLKLATAYLSLGRPDRVEQVASWILPESSGRRLLVLAAMSREDPSSVRALLQRLFPDMKNVLGGSGGLAESVTSAFITAGLLDSAERLISMKTHGEMFHKLVDAKLAVARGRVARGVDLLDGLLADEVPWRSWLRLRASLVLADVWETRGDPARAAAILESASRQQRALFEDLSPENLNVRERLSQLYRRVGRIPDAEAIESDLRRLLAVAQEDYPMKLRLARIGGQSTNINHGSFAAGIAR